MKIERGVVVWISVDKPSPGAAQAVVLEIESRAQEFVRLRDSSGNIHICSVHELHALERQALLARLEQEAFWARRYRAQAEECCENIARLRRRLDQVVPRRAIRMAGTGDARRCSR
jgi:hypothetical protein